MVLFSMINALLHPCKASFNSFAKTEGTHQAKQHKVSKMELTITQPDDWHLYLRDGDVLEAVVPHSASHFGRGIVMPNLKPSVTTTTAALKYRESILKVLSPRSRFAPLMTLYLTDTGSPEEIKRARKSGVVFAVKLYPAGAKTNSQDGVTDLFGKCFPVLKEMVEQNMSLLSDTVMTGKSGVVFAVKLYPAGAKTNSQDGVTDLFGKCFPVLKEMVEQNMSLLVGSMGERQRETRRTTKGKEEKRRKIDEQLKIEKGERQNLNDQ